MRTEARWLGPIAALGVVVAMVTMPIGPAHAESNGGVRVMPLGDSITEGTQTPGGSRIGLWQRLVNDGYTVDYVGSQFNGPASLGDHDHEGHPGWRIDQIDANIVGWLNTYQPHTVLLHIGTNDVLQDNSSTAPNRLSTLIDRITTTAPTAEVFVAQIIPLGWSEGDAAVNSFNAAIPGIVQSKVNAGKKVHLVDMHSALTASDLDDGVHPTAAGYDKMAAVWYNALRGRLGSPALADPTKPPNPAATTRPPTTKASPSARASATPSLSASFTGPPTPADTTPSTAAALPSAKLTAGDAGSGGGRTAVIVAGFVLAAGVAAVATAVVMYRRRSARHGKARPIRRQPAARLDGQR